MADFEGAAAAEAATWVNTATKMATFRAAARVLGQALAESRGAAPDLELIEAAEWAALVALVREVRARTAPGTAAARQSAAAGSPDCWVPR